MKNLMIVAALGLIGNALAADLEAGRKIAEAQCAACHGKDGKTSTDPAYPKLAGQYADYLVKALNDYNTGARKNAIMGGMAKPLSKQDIQNLAAHFESLPGPLTHRK
jgi:cytochrome c553